MTPCLGWDSISETCLPRLIDIINRPLLLSNLDIPSSISERELTGQILVFH